MSVPSGFPVYPPSDSEELWVHTNRNLPVTARTGLMNTEMERNTPAHLPNINGPSLTSELHTSDLEPRTIVVSASHIYLPIMGLTDFLDDCQPKPGPRVRRRIP